MNKILLLTIITFFQANAQSWKYDSHGSVFDGKKKIAYVEGESIENLYDTPALSIVNSGNGIIHFFMLGVGDYEHNGLGVLWVFDNEPETIYSSNGVYHSEVGGIPSIKLTTTFNDPKTGMVIGGAEFINKLKKSNNVSVRIKDNYRKNDFTFSLSGSSKAISFVIPNLDIMISSEKVFKERRREKCRELLFSTVDSINLTTTSFIKLVELIYQDLFSDSYDKSLFEFGKAANYNLIKAIPHSDKQKFLEQGYVDLYYYDYEGSEEKLDGSFQVHLDSPLIKNYIKNKEVEEIDAEGEEIEEGEINIRRIVEKYSYEPLKKEIIRKASRFQNNYYPKKGSFDLHEIKNIMVVIDNYIHKKYWECLLEIELLDGKIITTKLFIPPLDITREILKSMGGSAGQKF